MNIVRQTLSLADASSLKLFLLLRGKLCFGEFIFVHLLSCCGAERFSSFAQAPCSTFSPPFTLGGGVRASLGSCAIQRSTRRVWDSAAWAIGDGAPLHEARAPGAPAVPRTVRQGQVEPHVADARAGRGSGGGLYAVHAEYEMFEHTYVVYRCAFCSAVRLFGCSAVRLFGCSAVRLFNLILQNYIKLSEQQDFLVRKKLKKYLCILLSAVCGGDFLHWTGMCGSHGACRSACASYPRSGMWQPTSPRAPGRGPCRP